MWLFGKSQWERVVDALERQVRDLQDSLIAEREAHHKERTVLVDRIMALANPATLREVRREKSTDLPVAHKLPGRMAGSHPGYFVDRRPSHAPDWMSGRSNSGIPVQDLKTAADDIASAMAAAGAEATKKS